MKKLLMVFFTALMFSLSFANEVENENSDFVVEETFFDGMKIYTRIGTTPWSDYTMDGTSADGDGIGYEIALEVTKDIKQVPNLEAGIGIGYYRLSDGETRIGHYQIGKYEKYQSYPLYLTAKYTFPIILEDGIVPYLKADLGYAFNGSMKYDVMGETGKVGIDNGIYAGIGAGIEQNGISVDIMYKTTQGKVHKDDVDNYRITASVSYKFDIGKN